MAWFSSGEYSMPYIQGLLLLIALLLSSMSWATDPTQTGSMAAAIGEVSVPLADRSSDSLQAAEKAALTQVLVRLTGREDAAALVGAGSLLSDPGRWLSQYGYGKADDGSQTLEAHFDADALSRALLAAGDSVWPLSRPPLLLWLVTPEGLAVKGNAPLLQQQAQARGLPLLLPVSADELDTADVTGRFMKPVLAASKPYHADLVVTAVIYGGAQTLLNWWLYQKGQLLFQGQRHATDITSAKMFLINQVSSAVAQRYAVQGGKVGGHYLLAVDGINQLADWHYLDQYLSNLAGVTQATMTEVDAAHATWQVSFVGSEDQLHRLLDVNSHLSECARQNASASQHLTSVLPLQPPAASPSPAQPSAQMPVAAAPSSQPVSAVPAGPQSLVFCWQS
jgi:hypothetical protein